MKYNFIVKEGATFAKKKAIVYGKFLMNLNSNIGEITPNDIVKASIPVSAPTHDYFEWDNTIAGDKYRLHQARELINHIQISVVSGRNEKIYPLFINVNNSEHKGYNYFATVLNDKESRDYILKQALQQIQTWKEKYKNYSEFEPIIKVINNFKIKQH